uniref:Uncharacterized protein n=1 Tax=Oryza sativa subsp. japonica TaxID=39947 RepID=Q5JJR0_ORYSJ|nr:hypothetical protein [Oryza sativa Japonica Group]BAD88297.1 hypothetical protein [Oryza sativa Japonica Group]
MASPFPRLASPSHHESSSFMSTLVARSLRLHVHQLELEKTNLLLRGTLYPLQECKIVNNLCATYSTSMDMRARDLTRKRREEDDDDMMLFIFPALHLLSSSGARNKEEKEPKKQKKSVGVEGLMERYLDMRTKQAEDEAAQLAREREAHLAKEKENNDFSIKKCISILNSMVVVTKQEKANAYTVFKNAENREIFVSTCQEDAESALIWLRSEMA